MLRPPGRTLTQGTKEPLASERNEEASPDRKDPCPMEPTNPHRACLEAAAAHFVDRGDEFGARILEMIRATVPFYGQVDDPGLLSEIERDCRDHAMTVLGSIASEQPLSDETIERLAMLGRRRFETDVPLHALQVAYQTGALELSRIAASLLKEVCPLADVLPALTADVSEKLFAISTRLVQAISASYTRAQEEVAAGPARAKRGPMDDLLEGDAAFAEDIRKRATALRLVLGDQHVVAIVGPRDPRAHGIEKLEHRRALAGALQKAVSKGFSSSAVAPTCDRRVAVVASCGKRAGEARALAQRIEQVLAAPASAACGDLVAGASCVEPGVHGIHAGYRHALEALRAVIGTRRVMTYEQALPVLMVRDDPPHAKELVRLVAVPLREHDRRSRAKLIESIEAFLLAGGVTARAAKALSLDRRSLTHRFQEIKRITGCRIRNPEDLVILKLALDALRFYPEEAGE